MTLVETYPLKDQADPALYLKKEYPGWAEAFPLPLDEANAQTLINDWLRDADKTREERKKKNEQIEAFTCWHCLTGDLSDWSLKTGLLIPEEYAFQMDHSQLQSTRFEVTFYEGERLVARGGSIYGQLEGDSVSVRFPKTSVHLNRFDISKPVSLRLLGNGMVIHSAFFKNSDVYSMDSLLVFDKQLDDWVLVGMGSCTLTSGCVRIYAPKGFKFSSASQEIEQLASDLSDGTWFEATESVTFENESEYCQVELNQPKNADNYPSLNGINALYDGNPSTIYVGWPELEVPEEYEYKKNELVEFINGNRRDCLDLEHVAGSIRYSLRTKEGKTIFSRRFGVLPKNFNISMVPAINESPAKLQIKSSLALRTLIPSGEIHGIPDGPNGSSWVLYNNPSEIITPIQFPLEIMSDTCQQPLRLNLPYPQTGAQLIGVDGKHSLAQELIVEQLIGHRIIMASGEIDDQNYFMQFQLISRERQILKRDYVFSVGRSPVVVNLYGYQNSIIQMLGSVDDQDAFVRLIVETGFQAKKILSIDIRRFNGAIHVIDQHQFEIRSHNKEAVKYNAKVCAMQISNPQQGSLTLEESTSEGVGTGLFCIDQLSKKQGLWLIIPDKSSPVTFRPNLFPQNFCKTDQYADPKQSSSAIFNPILFPESYSGGEKNVESLHRAAECYHPVHNPRVIDEQIVKMATDFQHSGWQYLSDLKANYEHIPLSTFESWKALAGNAHALAFGLYRLDGIDELFCQRISEELAVIWEEIPIDFWVTAQKNYIEGIRIAGVPDVMVGHLVQRRHKILKFVVSGFDEFEKYIGSGNISDLSSVPIDVILPLWYQDLRRRHESNNNWPTKLRDELVSWIKLQDLPEFFTNLSTIEFTDSVTYLPIFMASLTAGKAHLTDLPVPPIDLKYYIRRISDFDRNGWYSCVHAMVVSYLLKSDAGLKE